MDILRNLFGSLTSGIIRLLVTVGIIAAAYFFLLKPVLETTDKAIESTNRTFEQSFGVEDVDLTDVGKTIEQVNRRVERQIRRSFHAAEKEGNPKRLVRCIKKASGNVDRIKRCTVKF